MTEHTADLAIPCTARDVPHGEAFRTTAESVWMRLSEIAERKLRKLTKGKSEHVFAISLGNGHMLELPPEREVELIEVHYTVLSV